MFHRRWYVAGIRRSDNFNVRWSDLEDETRVRWSVPIPTAMPLLLLGWEEHVARRVLCPGPRFQSIGNVQISISSLQVITAP